MWISCTAWIETKHVDISKWQTPLWIKWVQRGPWDCSHPDKKDAVRFLRFAVSYLLRPSDLFAKSECS